jgi:uncharacterized protein
MIKPVHYELQNKFVEPLAMLNVDHLGNIGLFLDTSHVDPEKLAPLAIASINGIDSIRTLEKITSFHRFWSEVQSGTDSCRRSCDYFDICGGGRPLLKFAENGSLMSTETMNCLLFTKTLGKIAIQLIEESATEKLIAAGIH